MNQCGLTDEELEAAAIGVEEWEEGSDIRDVIDSNGRL